MNPKDLKKSIGEHVASIVRACYNLSEKKQVTDVMDRELGLIFGKIDRLHAAILEEIAGKIKNAPAHYQRKQILALLTPDPKRNQEEKP